MNDLQPEQFDQFFEELYPYPPMSWQTELAVAACAGNWPDYICLPTGAGKTSTIDIAIFALAFQAGLPAEERTAAMRTFLVVDRRTVVSDAFHRASELQKQLTRATGPILKVVADRLKSYSGGHGPPLSVVELRGGIYRDPAWCYSLVQPMIVTSTVDQVGSRLLFRGYGVSNSARPIQAAAVAHDSLIILDEAHISPAFSETLNYVRAYQRPPWSGSRSRQASEQTGIATTNSGEVGYTDRHVPLPMKVVEMTATPPAESHATKLEISQTELNDASTHIGRIVNTSKLATLDVAENIKGAKAPAQLAAVLVAKALESVELDGDKASETTSDSAAGDRVDQPRVVGIMCNMVTTGKEVCSLLMKNKKINAEQVHLIIGAMRPIDRDKQTDDLRRLISTGSNRSDIKQPLFVVATQCIEVGADYDFDVLVTEAAPLDSLVQRFGRLNRGGRPIKAAGHIVMRGDRVKDDTRLEADDKAFKTIDPIYGNAMSHTWNWLTSVAENGSVDFGIASFRKLVSTIDNDRSKTMATGQSHAPVLLPAHLDLLCQTSVDPWPDPDVSLWLHGPERNDPEVQVCWRADLVPMGALPHDDKSPVLLETYARRAEDLETAGDNLIHTVSLCPPSSAECLSIPLRRVLAWLTALAKQKKAEADLTADVPAIVDVESESQTIPSPARPVAWRGLEDSRIIGDVKDIRPGDTLVFPVTAGGWTELGFVPEYNDWLPRTEDGQPLTNALRTAADEGKRVVECDRDDFWKLSGIDRGNVAFVCSRNRAIVRLHPSLVDTSELRQLYKNLRYDPNFKLSRDDKEELTKELRDKLTADLRDLPISQLRFEYYADRSGVVITGPRSSSDTETVLSEDDGSDLYSRITAGQPIELSDHLEHVRDQVAKLLNNLPLDAFRNTLLRSAEVHDWGKADLRFQAMLLGGDSYSALWETKLFAKSAKMPGNLQEREFARVTSELPKSFRHELLSMSLVEAAESVNSGVEDQELLLHLVASHHGHARPWAPVCDDPEPPDVSLERLGMPEIALSERDRQTISYHRVDSPIIDRFWQTTVKYGWWGTAFLESVFRLADRRASQIEGQLQASNAARTPESSAIPAGANP